MPTNGDSLNGLSIVIISKWSIMCYLGLRILSKQEKWGEGGGSALFFGPETQFEPRCPMQ